jgi:uncharacterized protein (DUF1800 family)
MAPMADDLTSRLAHLYRRAGFSARPAELDAARSAGFEGTINNLLFPQEPDVSAVAPPALDPVTNDIGGANRQELNKLRNQQENDLIIWWLDHMTMAAHQGKEKLTWFWHDHFATSAQKVNNPHLMLAQNQTFRRLGMGNFEELTQAIAKDGAMMLWLDSNKNNKNKPNENFSRELMELFTLGIGNYTDADVREAARAFTGWRFQRDGGFVFRGPQHDNGSKSLLGRTGNLTGEQVVSLLCQQPATAKFITAKLWRQYAFPVGTDHPIVSELSGPFAKDLNITKLLRSILLHPQFVSAEARRALVKQPVEWLVGAMRQLNVRPATLNGRPNVRQVTQQLSQLPFFPPSVGGWPDNGYWISTSTAMARFNAALALATAADLSFFSGSNNPGRLDALALQLGVFTWTPATANAITRAGNPRHQLATALCSPEYVLN